MKKLLFLLMIIGCQLFAIEPKDQYAIEGIIQGYTDAWNVHKGKGFADGFTENAHFINIFGMQFVGKSEIEERHIKILDGFLKDSTLTITEANLQELRPDVVLAYVNWQVDGFKLPSSAEKRNGIFTQVFVKNEGNWEIATSQNTILKE